MLNPYASEQVYEHYGNALELNGSALQMQLQDGRVTPSQIHVAHSFDPSPALYTHAANNTGSFGDTRITPTIPMGPPTRPRKRKAPTLRASDWEPYKARIVELHIMEKRPLQEVREAIKMEFGFTAEYVSFKGRLLVF